MGLLGVEIARRSLLEGLVLEKTRRKQKVKSIGRISNPRKTMKERVILFKVGIVASVVQRNNNFYSSSIPPKLQSSTFLSLSEYQVDPTEFFPATEITRSIRQNIQNL